MYQSESSRKETAFKPSQSTPIHREQAVRSSQAAMPFGTGISAFSSGHEATQLMALQQTLGNRATMQRVRTQQQELAAQENAPIQRAVQDNMAEIDELEATMSSGQLEEEATDLPVQRASIASASDMPVQRIATAESVAGDFTSSESSVNQTGMPDALKSGIENMSGMDMSDVRVHYNSHEPNKVNAHAYAQGSDIHLAPGQDQHLPHEAWHVVQQRQGRVQPTMQLAEGVAINDDAGLEQEATDMGNRAMSQSTMQLQAINAINSEYRTSMNKKVIQRISLEETQSLNSFFYRNKNLIYPNPMRWMEGKVSIDKYLNEVFGTLEDDEDVELWTNYKTYFVDFDLEIQKSYDKMIILLKEDIGKLTMLVVEVNQNINTAYIEFKKFGQLFRQTEGGFSAKGRAHAIDKVELHHPTKKLVSQSDEEEKMEIEDEEYAEDKSYTENISIDGNSISSVYKSNTVKKKVAETSGALIFGKKFSLKGGVKFKKDLDDFEEKVNNPIYSPNKAEFSTIPTAMPREQTQAAAMANTNAAGYALMSGIPDWNSHKWEWLHIRAASLGGVTNASNLVLGNRDVNTHMMPFEANIKLLAGVVKNHKHIIDKLSVNFYVEGIDGDAKHQVNSIVIDWKIVYKLGIPFADYPKVEGKAVFKPLNGSSSISKIEVGHLENLLKSSRDGLKDKLEGV